MSRTGRPAGRGAAPASSGGRTAVVLVLCALVAGLVWAGPAQAAPSAPRILMTVGGRQVQIATMTATGTGVRRLTAFPAGRAAQHPASSPSGDRIAFAVLTTATGVWQLWLMDADGGHQHRLAPTTFWWDMFPSWSPDGRWIVFNRCRPGFLACQIARVAPDGSGLTELTALQPETNDFAPTYSPDGSRIAFDSFGRGGVQGAVYVMSATGTGLRRVTPAWIGAGFRPTWSPDGRSLVFSSRCCTPQSAAIWRIGADGSGLRQVTQPGARHDLWPAWSPDGRLIAFERDEPDFSGWHVFTVPADGGQARQVGPAFCAQPAWSPAS